MILENFNDCEKLKWVNLHGLLDLFYRTHGVGKKKIQILGLQSDWKLAHENFVPAVDVTSNVKLEES